MQASNAKFKPVTYDEMKKAEKLEYYECPGGPFDALRRILYHYTKVLFGVDPDLPATWKRSKRPQQAAGNVESTSKTHGTCISFS